MAGEEKQPEENAVQSVAAKPQSGGNRTIIMIVVFAIVLSLLPGVAYAGIFFSVYRSLMRSPAPNTLGQVGQVNCASWNSAPSGYQDPFTKAANKAGIQPALLGAIFLSEHSNSWPGIPADGQWAKGGKGQGPFQIENWESYWKQVQAEGLDGGVTLQNASVNDLYFSGLATATSIRVGFNKNHIPLSTTEQKYVMFAGMYHNRGSDPAQQWADAGYDLNNPPANPSNPGWEWGANDYAHRTWTSFQGLNVGCSAVGASDNKIVQVAAKELTSTDANCSKYATGQSCYIKWCAYFASWVYKQAGYNIPSTGGASTLKDWFANNGHTVTPTPKGSDIKPGDLIFVGSGGKITHTGIVQNVVGDTVYTIEGNAGGGTGKVKSEKWMAKNIMFIGRW